MSMVDQLFTWFRTKFSGRASPVRHYATAEQNGSEIETWKRNAHALLANEANWRLVRELLGRLEGAGLRINPELDRDLIIVRLLRSLANQFEGDDLATVFAEQKTGEREAPLILSCLAI